MKLTALYSLLVITLFSCSSSDSDTSGNTTEPTVTDSTSVQENKTIECTLTGLIAKTNDSYVFPKGSGVGHTITLEFTEPTFISFIQLKNPANYAWITKVAIILDNDVESLPLDLTEQLPIQSTVKSVVLRVEECMDERFVIYERPGGYRTVANQNPDKQIGIGDIIIANQQKESYKVNFKINNTENPSITDKVNGTILEDLLNNRLGNYSLFTSDSTIVTEFEYGLRQSFRDKYIQYDKFSELLLKSDMTYEYGFKTGSSSEPEYKNGNWSIQSLNADKATILLDDKPITVTKSEIKGEPVDLMLRKGYKNYFVNIADCYPEANYVYDMRYATDNNFLKKDVYEGCANCFLREDAAKALFIAQTSFRSKGLRIKFFDCYRPLDIQKKMWEIYPHPGYVADPAKGSMHNRGAAVDMTLVDLNGKELDMGTGFDHFGKEAWHAYEDLSDTIKANRILLKTTMEQSGFRSIRTEWWHYSLVKPGGHQVANVPICIE